MQSKRSSFDPTLFRKNLSRSWPLWGGLSIAGSLAPLYMLLAILDSYSWFTADASDFTSLLYDAVTVFGPALAAGYAILCAMLVWSYLDSPRAVGFMHTLPLHRDNLFLTNTLSGVAMLLIPYVVVGGLLCVVAACFGFFNFFAVAQTAVAVILMNLLFFGLATLCAMVTGNIFAMPVLYGVVNFAAPVFSLLMKSLASAFLVGVPGSGDPAPVSTALSPLIQIYTSFSHVVEWVHRGQPDAYPVHTLEGLWIVAIYGLVGIALLGLSWLLYRFRRSESAGDVVAFRWMRPVFRYGLAFLSALTLGYLLYIMLWQSLFQEGRYADIIPMIVCMTVAGLVGYYVASMLLEKSLRVFKNSWQGALVICAGAVLFVCTIGFDFLGMETKIPHREEIKEVRLNSHFSLELTAGDDDELMEKVLTLHSDLVAERDIIRSVDRRDELSGPNRTRRDWMWVDLEYRLKDGSTLRREYSVPISFDWMDTPEAYDDKLVEFLNDPAVLARQVPAPKGGKLQYMYLENNYGDENGETRELTGEEARTLYDAILRDAQAGNLLGYQPQGWPGAMRSVRLEMNFRVPDENGTYYDPESGETRYGFRDWYDTLWVSPFMIETVDTMLELELVTMEQVEQWSSDWNKGVMELLEGDGTYDLPETAVDAPAAYGD